MSTAPGTNTQRVTFAMIVSLTLVACVDDESEPAPLLRAWSAQSEQGATADEIACTLQHFAMPFCAGRGAEGIDEGVCRDNEEMENVLFRTIGGLVESSQGLRPGRFVARLYHEDGVAYANIEESDISDFKPGFSTGLIQASALCDLASGATIRPTKLEIGFRSNETGHVTPLATIDAFNSPFVWSQDPQGDCSTATYEPPKLVTWNHESRACSPDETWTAQPESEAELEPEEDATYYAEPTCFAWDEELGTCTDVRQEIAGVTFGSSDSMFFNGLVERLHHYVEEWQRIDPEFDVYAYATVFVESDGVSYVGDAFPSVSSQLIPTDIGAEGFVPANRFEWGESPPPPDAPVSLTWLIVEIPDVSEEPLSWIFEIPGDQVPVLWASE